MTRKQKQIGAALGVAAIVAFTSWPLYKYFRVQAAIAATEARQAQAKALVDQNPQLKAAWDNAMSDDVVTEVEVTEILAQGDAPAETGK